MAESYENLSVIADKEGDRQRGIELLQKALTILKEAYGEENLDCASVQHNFGVLYINSNNLDAAKPLLKKAYITRNKLLGMHHPGTISAKKDLEYVVELLNDKVATRSLPSPSDLNENEDNLEKTSMNKFDSMNEADPEQESKEKQTPNAKNDASCAVADVRGGCHHAVDVQPFSHEVGNNLNTGERSSEQSCNSCA